MTTNVLPNHCVQYASCCAPSAVPLATKEPSTVGQHMQHSICTAKAHAVLVAVHCSVSADLICKVFGSYASAPCISREKASHATAADAVTTAVVGNWALPSLSAIYMSE